MTAQEGTIWKENSPASFKGVMRKYMWARKGSSMRESNVDINDVQSFDYIIDGELLKPTDSKRGA